MTNLQNLNDIPVYIISFNRLSDLKKLVHFLEQAGLGNIHIIDNASSFPPLLDYYKSLPYPIHRMDKNYGHMVFYEADEFKDVRENQYYILTDPDILPIEECPHDFMKLFYDLLQKYPKATKVGFALKTDDLPEQNRMNKLIIKWEQQFYKHRLNWPKPDVYLSSLDTTFALYRPKKEWKKGFYTAIRTGYPYEARHLPWYKDLNDLTEEDKFYNSFDCGSGHWVNPEKEKGIEELLLGKDVWPWYQKLFSIKKATRRYIVRIFGLKITIKRKVKE